MKGVLAKVYGWKFGEAWQLAMFNEMDVAAAADEYWQFKEDNALYEQSFNTSLTSVTTVIAKTSSTGHGSRADKSAGELARNSLQGTNNDTAGV